MKKVLIMTMAIGMILTASLAQDNPDQQLQAAVARLGKATAVKDYRQLAIDFAGIAAQQKNNWLSWYYAAFCNAKTGWLYENDGERIEPFANLADEQIKKSLSLLDTATQKKELSEVYCVLSMVNRAKVFINPMTYGRQYGPVAGQYVQKALALDATNPRAVYLAGWEKYATPKMWGGDKKKAKELLEQSLQQLNAQGAAGTAPHWGKQEVEALLKKLK
ncbi:hypothetical protein HB364_26015 [Pseudoflavitalea sp. X16]|uniref:hypothetical protein n=1 Tax=Paraflavitalea devenefica TaxID=2716334 RepID=UPI00141D9BAB|nr:hypothetical protein [Paraflavitalea devenefica]NII28566.1 hypothetical protein [Paraflavitalea devenefica]